MPKGKPRNKATPRSSLKGRARPEPKLWKVILHNDDFTTQEFVIHVLEVVFNKEPSVAHESDVAGPYRGMCVAGVYTYEIAETKVATVEHMARAAEFPIFEYDGPE